MAEKAPQTKPTVTADSLEDIVAETQRRLLERPELLAMRMENESIMAECRARPRDMKAIQVELLEQLDAFPDLAEAAIYNKPVGKDRDGREKFASGLSIRAAETLAEAYGYNRIRTDVTPLDSDRVKIDATFSDYQKGRIWQDGGILSQYYTDRSGRRVRHNDDRFFSVVCKGEASKRVREVILRSVNSGLKAWFEAECRRRLADLLDDDKIAGIVHAFSSIGVTLLQLEAVIGRPKAMGWTSSDRQSLVGIWNAIRDGEASVETVFAPQPEPAAKSLQAITERLAAARKEKPPEPKPDVAPEPPAPEEPTRNATDPLYPTTAEEAETFSLSAEENQEEPTVLQRALKSIKHVKTLEGLERINAQMADEQSMSMEDEAVYSAAWKAKFQRLAGNDAGVWESEVGK